MGAIVAALEHEGHGTGVSLPELYKLIEYWESVRRPTARSLPCHVPLATGHWPLAMCHLLFATGHRLLLTADHVPAAHQVRFSYAAFESGQKSGSSEVYK